MRSLVLALFLVGLAAAPAGAQQPFAAGVGPGAFSCAEFAEQYRADPSFIEIVYFSWAQGYLTGLNIGLRVDTEKRKIKGRFIRLNPPEFDADQQQAFIRGYCADNPLKDYIDAVREVWAKLHELDR